MLSILSTREIIILITLLAIAIFGASALASNGLSKQKPLQYLFAILVLGVTLGGGIFYVFRAQDQAQAKTLKYLKEATNGKAEIKQVVPNYTSVGLKGYDITIVEVGTNNSHVINSDENDLKVVKNDKIKLIKSKDGKWTLYTPITEVTDTSTSDNPAHKLVKEGE